MSRIYFGFALVAACLLVANTARAQEKRPEDRPAARLERALQDLNRASEEIREQIKVAEKDGNDERVAQLKAKAERVENNIRDTKTAFQKFREQQAVEKKAAADKAAAEGKSAERFERQMQELKKANEQVSNEIKAAEKEGYEERVAQL
jgi:hypothetical protein